MRLASLLGPDIKQILKEDPDQIGELLDEIHAEDLADLIGDLDPDEAAELLARLPAEDAAPIFERLDEHEQGELVEQMPTESIAEIASEMAADDRADLFSTLPEEVGEQVFQALERVDPEAAYAAYCQWVVTGARDFGSAAAYLEALRAEATRPRIRVRRIALLPPGRATVNT